MNRKRSLFNRRYKPSAATYRLIHWFYALIFLLIIYLGLNWLIDSDHFPVLNISISESENGYFSYVTQAELENAQRNSIVGNIFKVNLNTVKLEFEQISWIKNAEVQRILPDTIAVQLTERKPLAHWNDDKLIDTDANVFSATIVEDLPYLYGVEGSEKNVVDTYSKIKALLDTHELRVKRLIYEERSSWQVELTNGITVKLGGGDTIGRMSRFVDFWPQIKPQSNDFTYVDMRYRDGFAIKYNK